MEIRYDKTARSVKQLQQTLAAYLDALPALMWHVDTVRNEMIFFNDHKVAGLNGKIPLMLRNMSLAQALVHPDDFSVFRGALDAVRVLQPCSVSFRVHDDAGNWHWLVLMGMPAPDESFGYVGLAAECTSLVESMMERGADSLLAGSMELLDSPALLVDFTTKNVQAANAAACVCFGYAAAADFPSFETMLEGTGEQYRRSIYEHLIFHASWRGALTLAGNGGMRMCCRAQLRPVSREGHNYLWVSLTPAVQPAEAAPVSSPVSAALREALSRAADDMSALTAVLEHQPQGMQAEGVMLSRIYAADDKVEVTGAGAPFDGMEPGTAYPYRGSIAENIVRYNLPHLVVDETARSIRPIDWALFIPGGIHSYYAEPFYAGDTLKYVLIYCSTRSEAFSADGAPACKEVVRLLAQTLKRLDGAYGGI